MGPEELDSLKQMMESQMGMPVDELLERKEELEKELPPEGKKLFVLMERLFGKDGPPALTRGLSTRWRRLATLC